LPTDAFDKDDPAFYDTDLAIQDEKTEDSRWLIDTKPAMLAELTPEDIARRFIDITGAIGHLQEVLPPEHPDIVNLRAAVHDILDNPEAMSKLESLAGDIGHSKLGEGNPYENDDITPFEQPDNTARNILGHPDLSPLQQDIPAMFDGMEQAAMPVEENMLLEDDHINEQSLEHAVEGETVLEPQSQLTQDDMMQMMEAANPEMTEPVDQDFGIDSMEAFDEINQAIDQLTEQPVQEELEPDPFQMQYDPFMEQQYMFDPQYMPDYMAGGPMPPGHMGPMLGP
jgi:hypothetical protein